MKKITASILTTLLMLSMVFSSSVFAANEETSAWDSFLGLFSAKASADDVGVEYRGHIQNVGDYPTDGSWIQGPERLGTVGKSLRLEAFWIKLTDAPEGLHIKYEVHVQNIGWMAPVEDGKLAGTQGDSLRIEAIKISLVDDEGNVSGDYTVTYKGHIQNVGDTAWIKSGQQLGTTGSGLRLEALEVKIEKIAPDLTDYEAALAAVTEANYTKASWAAYQDVVEDNVMTEDNVQSEVDAATAIILDAQADLVTVPVISGMTATAQKQITVTGTQLADLKAANLAVAGNTVTSVVANADGTSAVVTLGTDLVPDTNVKVTATIDGTAKDYTVKYSIAATTVVVQSATYDDDKANQALTVLVNGVETTPSYLASSGYTVTFRAWKNGVATTDLFNALTSTSGVLNMTPATVKDNDYTVNVTIQKGSSIAVSEKATIKIRDLDNNASEISATELTNITKGCVMTSGKLVAGETARFSKVTVGYGDASAELTTGFAVESSNSAVISVNSTTKVMTANGTGTANITVTVGKASVVVPVTVVGEARKASTVTSKEDNVSIIVGVARNATVVVKDQYGDPFVGATSLTYVLPTSITGLTCTTPMTSNAKGEVTLAYGAGTTTANQTGIVVFKNSDKVVVGSQNLTTVPVSGVESTKVVYDATSESTDDVIYTDLTSKDSLTYKVSQYGANNVWISDLTTLAGYTVMFDGNYIAVNGDTTGTYVVPAAPVKSTLVVTPIKAGTSSFVVLDTTSAQIDSRTITVLKDAPKISSISFKTPITVNYAKTINYKDVLNYSDMTLSDDIISGVTLTTSSVFNVRIDELGTFVAVGSTPAGSLGALYLDKDDSGRYSAGDVKLASFNTKVSADATGTWVAGTTSDGFTGQAVVAGDKGTLNFTVVDLTTAPYTTIVGSTYTTVNVAQSVVDQAMAAINAGAQTTPATITVANYAAAGVTGVTSDNLVYVNQAVKAAYVAPGYANPAAVQAVVTAPAAAYTTAVANVVLAETAPITAAKVATAQANVTALTAGPAATALQTRLDAVSTAIVAAAKASLALTVNTPSAATSTITVPTTDAANGATIAWVKTSGTGTFVSPTFTTAARPAALPALSDVLTATITSGNATAATQAFTVSTPPTGTDITVTKN